MESDVVSVLNQSAWSPHDTIHKTMMGRLGKVQEHCTVCHMICLTQTLFCWTGDTKYADFEELNFYNGILAQQNQYTGIVMKFLDRQPCSTKNTASISRESKRIVLP